MRHRVVYLFQNKKENEPFLVIFESPLVQKRFFFEEFLKKAFLFVFNIFVVFMLNIKIGFRHKKMTGNLDFFLDF